MVVEIALVSGIVCCVFDAIFAAVDVVIAIIVELGDTRVSFAVAAKEENEDKCDDNGKGDDDGDDRNELVDVIVINFNGNFGMRFCVCRFFSPFFCFTLIRC